MHELLIFGVATLLAYILVNYIRRGTHRWRLIDTPNERSSHSQPTPSGGGAAIGLFTLLGVVVFTLRGVVAGPAVATFLVGGMVVAIVGLIDDIYTIPSSIRLLIQAGIAIFVVYFVGFWTTITLPVLGSIYIGALGAVVAVLWLVGLVNAYNFMDGTDGMAGGVGLVAGLGWALMPWPLATAHADLVRLAGLLLAGTCLGFLGHNWSPARIFMGDVGSTFLGFSLAIFSILVADQPAAALVGVLLVWPFLFDTIFTFLRRLRNGENVLASHRSHLYQRLVISGYSHQFVGLLYGLYSVIGGVLAWLWLMNVAGAGLAIIIVIPALCLGHRAFVARQERVSIQDSN